MIKWIIIALSGIAFVGIITLLVLLSRKKNKKKKLKLDENIKKLKSEQEQFDVKQKAEEDKRKEEKAFENITLTDDVEEEFKDLFDQPNSLPEINEENFDFEVEPNQNREEIEEFLKELEKQPKQKHSKDDFEEFLNEHSFSRRVFDNDLLAQIRNLPPKIKAIILGNVFNKFDD